MKITREMPFSYRLLFESRTKATKMLLDSMKFQQLQKQLIFQRTSAKYASIDSELRKTVKKIDSLQQPLNEKQNKSDNMLFLCEMMKGKIQKKK